MKYFIIILLVLATFFTSHGQDKNELILAADVNVLINFKRWKAAEEVITELLIRYPHSKRRENYYEALEWVLSEEYHEINLAHAKANPPDTTGPWGSITLVISQDLGPEANRILNKRINVSRKYLEEFPNGKLTTLFLTSLLSAYRELGKEQDALKLSQQLLNSKNRGEILEGAFTLGIYAHAQEHYKEAIDYYKIIINNTKDSNEKITYTYYIGVCYYELGDLKKAKQFLKRVFELSKENKNKDVEKVARITWDFIKEYEANPQIPKRHFIFIEGISGS